MSFNHININQLTNPRSKLLFRRESRACAQRMKIGKIKFTDITSYLCKGLTVQEIYNQYLINKSRCGKSPLY